MKARKLLINLSVFLFSGFVIVYIIIQLISGLTMDVGFEYALKQSEDDTLEKSCYLMRNETVLYATGTGVTNYSVSEAQKIGARQLIATVYSDEEGMNVQNQIQKINEKIKILEASAIDTSYLTSDISKIDGNIRNSILQMQKKICENDLSFVYQYTEDLLIHYNKRQLVTSNTENFSKEIQELQSLRSSLTATLQNPLCTVYSQGSGYFSTLLDGLESAFSPVFLDSLTVDSFHQMIQQEREIYDETAIGKVITDFTWYALCEVTKSEARDLVEGEKYPVTFLYSSNKKIEAVLHRIVEQTDSDTVVLVFLIEEVPQNFDYTRKQTIKIVKDTVEGISFSRSSLRYVDGIPGVYVIDGNRVGFRRVDIHYQSNALYYSVDHEGASLDGIKFLAQYDRVITEGKDLYIGKILD